MEINGPRDGLPHKNRFDRDDVPHEIRVYNPLESYIVVDEGILLLTPAREDAGREMFLYYGARTARFI